MTTVRDDQNRGGRITRTAGRVARAAGAAALIAAGIFGVGISSGAGAARALNTTEASQPTMVSDLLKRINIEREGRGLPDLTIDASLNQSAQAWAEHNRDSGTFVHTNPQPSGQGEIMSGLGDTAGAENSWMHSDGHRNTLLSPAFTRFGAGVACDSQGNGVAVVQFNGDSGHGYNDTFPQDPINGVNFEPDYVCPRPKPSTTTTTQSPPTTQRPTTSTTQKPTSSTTQPTAPPPTQPQPTTTTTQKTGGGSTTPTTSTTPPTTAPPPPPPPPPGQAALTVTPAQSVAGQPTTLAAAGACPSDAGTNVVALVDGDGRARATGQTTRASFGGSSAVHLELKPSLPAGNYDVVLLCADNTQTSVPHTRLPAGAPTPDPAAPAAVIGSTGGTPPTSVDGTPVATAPAPNINAANIRSVAAKDAARLQQHSAGGTSPLLPGAVAGVVTAGGIGATWFLHRRRALTAARNLIAT